MSAPPGVVRLAAGLDRRARLRLAAAVVALAVVTFLALRLITDWRHLPGEVAHFFHLDPRPLIAAWVIQTVGWLIVVDTWRRIVGHGAAALRLPLLRHMQVYAYTSLTQVLPGSIWQPMSRIALYRQLGVPAMTVSAAVVMEWMMLGVAGLVLYAVAAPFSRAVPPGWLPLLGLVALAALTLLHPTVFRLALRRAAHWLRQAAPPVAPAMRAQTGWLARETLVLACSGVGLYLLMGALTPAASLPDAMAAWGLSLAVASLLAWLPATALLKDGSMVLLLTPVYSDLAGDTGTAALIALGLVLAWRIWSVAVLLSWAALATVAARRLPLPTAGAAEVSADHAEPAA